MKCNCGSEMHLVFHTSKENGDYRFFWGCNNLPSCGNTKDYQTEGVKMDIANHDTMEALEILKNGSIEEKAGMINEVKVQMVEILNHFIDCTWGAHYMTLLNEMIIPYLDNPKVLKYVLDGPVIKEAEGNFFKGKSGAKMFYELLTYLKEVKSQRIQEFLDDEFSAQI